MSIYKTCECCPYQSLSALIVSLLYWVSVTKNTIFLFRLRHDGWEMFSIDYTVGRIGLIKFPQKREMNSTVSRNSERFELFPTISLPILRIRSILGWISREETMSFPTERIATNKKFKNKEENTREMTITVLVRYSWKPQVIINRISKMLIWITMTTVQISIIFSLLYRGVAFQTLRRPNTTLLRIWHDHMIGADERQVTHGNAVRQTCVAANIYFKWNNAREHAMPSHRQKRRRCLRYPAGTDGNVDFGITKSLR